MADFEKFSEIENHYRQKFINYIYEQGLNSDEWYETEKIHGSNLSFWIYPDRIDTARRSAILTPDESFNNYQAVLEKHTEGLRSLYEELSEKYPISAVAVYGEIYGGTYPHPEVEKSKGAVKIQGDIKYRPDNDLLAFNIKIVFKKKEDNHNRNTRFLDRDESIELFEKHNIPYLKDLFRGTLEECLERSPEFLTTIPATLGLPEIENNWAEGKVIMPVTEKRFRSGSRVGIKHKHPKFMENKRDNKPKAPPAELPDTVKKALAEAADYVNENRLRNVLSKLGDVTQKDFGKLLGMMIKDVVEDYVKDFDTLDSLDKADRKKFNKELGKDIGNLIRPNFLNIIDGLY